MMKINIKSLLFFVVLTILSLILHNLIAYAENLSKIPYTDPKGFFKIHPPQGWKVQEYPGDPRGKVAFFGPESNVDLRVLASVKDFNTFEKLLEVDKENLRDIERQFGIKVTIEKTTFLGRPAVRREFEIKGIKFLAFDFMVGNVRHDLQYGAPSEKFQKYLPIAMKSMETYEPMLKYGDKGFKEHQLANKKRLSKLFLDMGNFDLALQYVNEGLEIDPQNQELLRLKEEIMNKKRPK